MHILRSATCLAITYVALYFSLQILPMEIQQNGLMKHLLDFSSFVHQKAITASQRMQQANLAASFIGNMHKLNFQQSQEFQASGLVHLLAISGGQIAPVASLFSSFFSSCFYFRQRNRMNSVQLMVQIEKTRIFVHLSVSFFLSFLFGCTGALLRVAGLSFLSQMGIIKRFTQNSYQIIPPLFENTALKIILLILISVLFGNIFLNYSFILSAIGASCAEISALFVYSSLFKSDEQGFGKKIISSLLHSPLCKHVIAAVLTSALVGILLSPLVSSSLLNSCLANICAIPVVTFFVTPLALLVLIVPENLTIIYTWTLKLLDLSLYLFQKIASIFSDTNTFINPFDKHNPLFSKEGLAYLNTILICLWILIDILRNRKVLQMRFYITNSLKDLVPLK